MAAIAAGDALDPRSRGVFLATVYLPLADVITYYLACPIFVTALSAIVLREHVGWRRWSAVLIGFVRGADRAAAVDADGELAGA